MSEFIKFLGNLKPRVKSRRERMTYWMLAIGVFMFTLCLIFKVSLLDALAFYGGMSVVAGWYLQKETEKKSEEPM